MLGMMRTMNNRWDDWQQKAGYNYNNKHTGDILPNKRGSTKPNSKTQSMAVCSQQTEQVVKFPVKFMV